MVCLLVWCTVAYFLAVMVCLLVWCTVAYFLAVMVCLLVWGALLPTFCVELWMLASRFNCCLLWGRFNCVP
jgi:hypothetical protein